MRPRKPTSLTSRYRGCAKHRTHLSWGTLVASLLVGTVVTLSNHGDTLFRGYRELSFAWTIPLTYLLSLVLVVSCGPKGNRGGELRGDTSASPGAASGVNPGR